MSLMLAVTEIARKGTVTPLCIDPSKSENKLQELIGGNS